MIASAWILLSESAPVTNCTLLQKRCWSSLGTPIRDPLRLTVASWIMVFKLQIVSEASTSKAKRTPRLGFTQMRYAVFTKRNVALLAIGFSQRLCPSSNCTHSLYPTSNPYPIDRSLILISASESVCETSRVIVWPVRVLTKIRMSSKLGGIVSPSAGEQKRQRFGADMRGNDHQRAPSHESLWILNQNRQAGEAYNERMRNHIIRALVSNLFTRCEQRD